MRTAPRRVPARSELEAGFTTIRADLGVPVEFDAAVLDEATRSIVEPPRGVERAGNGVSERLDLELITIDPPQSVDLDQAVHIARRGEGYRVSYAISDPAAFVEPGGEVDREAHRRGVTLYAPDRRTPLYPPIIGENAASLLPGVGRPAVLWTLDLDEAGQLVDVDVERATVRSREQLSYREAQRRIDAGEGPETLALLREVGRLREQVERERGGVSLNLPSQEVELADGAYHLRFDETLPVEAWNAQISLLTGMAAADVMIRGGVGVLRRLPVPEPEVIAGIRRAALALGIDWPPEATYAERIGSIVPDRPAHVALLARAVRALRGADYAAFVGEPPDATVHWAIGADYSHVTAPIRRLGDRYANEIALALCSGTEVPAWVLAELETLPETLGDARRREARLDRAIVDYVETMVLRHRVGEVFHAWVTDRRPGDSSRIQIAEPAISATVDAAIEPGTELLVRLTEADTAARRVRFEPVDAPA